MTRLRRTESDLNRYKPVNARAYADRNTQRADGSPKRVQPRVRGADSISKAEANYEAILARLRNLKALVDATEADLESREVAAVRQGWEMDEEPVRPPMDSWDDDYALPSGGMKLQTHYRTPTPSTPYLQALAERLKVMKDVWLVADTDLQARGWRPDHKDLNAEKRWRGTTADKRTRGRRIVDPEPVVVSPIRSAFPDFFSTPGKAPVAKSRGKKPDIFDNLFDQILGRMSSR